MVTEAPIRSKPLDMTRARRLRRATGRILPTLATLGNLICGFAAVYFAARGGQAVIAPDGDQSRYLQATEYMSWFAVSGWLIFLAMIFDGLDGRLARMVRHTSDLGAQLDSLADVVSFGVAPAFLMLQVLSVRIGGDWFSHQWVGAGGAQIVGRTTWVIGAVFMCCAALRLARFNVETTADESAHMWFKGLPSPGAAAALASLVLLLEELVRISAGGQPMAMWAVRAVFWILPPVALATALLMVSNVPYPHGTNHFMRGRHPFRNLVLALLVIGLLLVFRQHSIALCSIGYMFSGPLVLAHRRLFATDRRTIDDMAEEIVGEDEDDSDPDPPAAGEG